MYRALVLSGGILPTTLLLAGCGTMGMHGMSHGTGARPDAAGTHAVRTVETGDLALRFEAGPLVSGRVSVLTIGVTEGATRTPVADAHVTVRLEPAAGQQAHGAGGHGANQHGAGGQVAGATVDLVAAAAPGEAGTYRVHHTFPASGSYEATVTLRGETEDAPPRLAMKETLRVGQSDHGGSFHLSKWAILGGLAMVGGMILEATVF